VDDAEMIKRMRRERQMRRSISIEWETTAKIEAGHHFFFAGAAAASAAFLSKAVGII
jgi:hypothetical protein